MQGSVFGRVGLAVAAFCLGVSGVVLATDGVAFPGASAEVVLTPAAATSGCAAVGPYLPPARGSVGVPAGTGLCPSGTITVTTPGAVLDGWDIRGGVVVAAADVVVRRSRVTGDGTSAYGIHTTGAGSVRIEDTTVTGRFVEAGIGGSRWTAERTEVVGVSGDGAHAGAGSRLRGSVLEGFPVGAIGLEVRGGGVVVEDSEIRMAGSDGSAIAVTTDDGLGGAVVVRANILGGGAYTVLQDSGDAIEVEIVDNRFVRDGDSTPVWVSPATVCTGNTYVDRAPLPGC